ncbi:MAG TPA: pancreas/duodenum homeobox protein 1 [Thermosulfurimonas dismutans]|uniref:Pancreas/duodenum homeobox protein 1 n=1 Tax=Thermosulfurimonas dismutans TaxID=999894 RepID=A0A7C3CGY8_9BACT|nr:pancreas/duodenum homeobox protein 1 [Thermosulfurimonas dismutans]
MFSEEQIKTLLPREKIEAFFEAFYFGEEPAYDLELGLGHFDPEQRLVRLELRLKARPGRCLACNLTWGLPEVFKRHPALDLQGVVGRLEGLLPDGWKVRDWTLGTTEEIDEELHVIPLIVRLG